MKVEIWSDVMCPFCYIGKRKFENALATFSHKNQIQLEWKSFLLNPNLKDEDAYSTAAYLASAKGISIEEATDLNSYVTEQAQKVGLDFHFDKAIITNTFSAHRLLQWAKVKEKGNAMEERLFRAFFTEGKRLSDKNTLAALAEDVGLTKQSALEMLQSGEFTDAVLQDLNEAKQFQIQGVPFFIFDRKYAISGAQDEKVFAQALEKSYSEWLENKSQTLTNLGNGNSCDVDGNCN